MIVASCYPNQNGTSSPVTQFGGPFAPLVDGTGWEWRYNGWVTDTVALTKISIEVRAVSLNTDSLPQLRGKILASIKAASQEQNLTPTIAIFDPMDAPVSIP